MAGNKMFEFAFKVAGKVDASFRNSFNGANTILDKTKKQMQDLNNTQKQLEASLKAGTVSQETYNRAMEKTNSQIKKLNDSQSRLNAAQNMKSEAAAGRQKKCRCYYDRGYNGGSSHIRG
ncbi:hypothetical protein LJC10_00510 [Selenomonadales bacterium OttesenSCG-928-I06]|nr:hypothetical protein [Selenomonadales bacterium OttesenSCG-928-I06]